MRGRKTKGGRHYTAEERKDIAERAADIGTVRAAKLFGISEASIKTWRQEFGIQQKNMELQSMGGSMDRYFCRACEHGCGRRSSFTGCTYILDTGEHRPHRNGWCLGFEPKDGTHRSTIEAYRRETQKHEKNDDSEDDDMVQDEVIISKKQGYTPEEKARVLEYAAEHSVQETVEYFKVSDVSVFKWKKELGEPTGYKTLTAEALPEINVGKTENVQAAAETSEKPGQRTPWDEYMAEQLRAHIAEIEATAERYRRMLRILEE